MIHVMTQQKDIGTPKQTYTYAKATTEILEKKCETYLKLSIKILERCQ